MLAAKDSIINISDSNNVQNDLAGGNFELSNITEIRHSANAVSPSVKLVLSGIEAYRINGRHHSIGLDRFLIVNRNSRVDLNINDKKGVKGICIFPAQALVNDVFRSTKTLCENLLDNPFKEESVDLLEKTFSFNENRTGIFLNHTVKPIIGKYERNEFIDFDDFYIGLVETLIQDQLEIEGKLKNLSSTRKATKEELYRRVSTAKDYIDSNYIEKINIQDLAQNAYLSKYHFIRTFKALYQLSPYQYLLRMRLEKAQELLKKEYSISEINNIIGFSDERNLRKALIKYA